MNLLQDADTKTIRRLCYKFSQENLKLVRNTGDKITGCMASLLDGERECHLKLKCRMGFKYLHSAAKKVIHLICRGV